MNIDKCDYILKRIIRAIRERNIDYTNKYELKLLFQVYHEFKHKKEYKKQHALAYIIYNYILEYSWQD